jgi:hypothetical protein
MNTDSDILGYEYKTDGCNRNEHLDICSVYVASDILFVLAWYWKNRIIMYVKIKD